MTAPSDAAPPPDLATADPPAERLDTAGSGAAANQRRRAVRLWWVSALLGVGGAVLVWLGTPHQRPIDQVWHLGVKGLAFAFLCCAIAFFPWASPRLHWLLYLPFIFYVGYIYPRIGYFYFLDTDHSEAGGYYTHQFLLSYPGMVLTVAAAYRLGGGLPGRCLKIAVTGMLIIFSGLLDILWWVVNPVDIPSTVDAPHINVFTGGPISFGAAIAFAAAHIPVIVGVNLLPVDRWIRRIVGDLVPPR